jgi:hypothetical protein
MLELLALIGLLLAGLAAFAVLALLFGLLKLGFKLLLLPIGLAWSLLKLVFICCLILAALAMAPVLLAILLVAVPALALAGLFGLGWAAVAA